MWGRRQRPTVESLVYRKVTKLEVPVSTHVSPNDNVVFFVDPEGDEIVLEPIPCAYCDTPRKLTSYGIGSIWRCPKCRFYHEMKKNRYHQPEGKLWSRMRKNEFQEALKEGRILDDDGPWSVDDNRDAS